MSDFFLDLRDKPRVVDFLVECVEYAAPQEQAEARRWIRAYEDGEKVPTDALAEAARTCARSAWPAQFALDRFFAQQGKEEEWQRVIASVRPSTAHLLQRFRRGTGTDSLDATLQHSESDTAFRHEERQEITEVRKQSRLEYWREHSSLLTDLVASGSSELALRQQRLTALRDLALDLPRSLQDEVFSKLTHYEDRLLFERECVPLDVLDAEVAYYTEQKELSPVE